MWSEKMPESRDSELVSQQSMTREPQSETAAEISEEEISALVRQAQGDDAEAFAQVLRLLQGKLHRQALFLAGDEHQALDLVQETMMETWKHIRRYDGRARFFSWMCSIMVHRHYDWLRRLRTRASTILSPAPDDHVGDEAGNPSDSAAEGDERRLMRECLDELPAKQREVVYLRFYAGEPLDGIAALVGCSLGTVKSRLFRGLSRLAQMKKLKELRKDR
jgi:RNA polymerase sigma-70 factor (ECF subfamily)